MKHSPYISWAKKQHDVKYNLAGSGMPPQPLRELVDDPREILQSGEHEDGWHPLMHRIAARYGVEITQIVLVDSASMANHLVCALFLEPDDDVLVEDPVYEPLVGVPQYLHANVIPFNRSAETNHQPNPEEIRRLITDKTKLIIISDMHNPSGAKIDKGILHSLIEIAEQYHLHILIDEVYLEFLYPNGQRTAATSSDQILTSRSLTKAFGLDDVRIGWVIAEPVLAERLRRLKDLFSTTLPFPSERLGAAALDQADVILDKNLKLLNRNLPLVHEFIENEVRLSWIKPPAGTVGFVKLDGGNTDQLVQTAHRRYQTIVTPGSFFEAPGHFRIGWGIPTKELKKGLRRSAKRLLIFSRISHRECSGLRNFPQSCVEEKISW